MVGYLKIFNAHANFLNKFSLFVLLLMGNQKFLLQEYRNSNKSSQKKLKDKTLTRLFTAYFFTASLAYFIDFLWRKVIFFNRRFILSLNIAKQSSDGFMIRSTFIIECSKFPIYR